MFLPLLSGLVVSIDAFFIGLSLGLQKKFKFLYLIMINVFLLALCFIGFFIAGRVYDLIPFDTDLIVGFTFIGLGLWYILHNLIGSYLKKRKGKTETEEASFKTIIIIGLVMSIEAMIITMGITFMFIENSTILIPIVVAFAHFGYSALSFYLARTKYIKKLPTTLSYIISGSALIIYGLMALFLEIM
ncbi:MAG: manganese efflux pump [Erysipelotrichales bacterium]|nr:manganese efflux pump [Erysipelotrichales bacterium]